MNELEVHDFGMIVMLVLMTLSSNVYQDYAQGQVIFWAICSSPNKFSKVVSPSCCNGHGIQAIQCAQHV